MTKESFGLGVLSQALMRFELAWAKGNADQAHAAVEYAFAQRPKETLADEDGVGFLGLDDVQCELLDAAGFESIGDVRRAGYARAVRALRDQAPDLLRRYATSQGLLIQKHAGSGRIVSKRKQLTHADRREIARHLAGRVRIAMQTFGVHLTRDGAKR